MPEHSSSVPTPAPPVGDVSYAYSRALEDLQVAARFLDLLLRTRLPSTPRKLEALACAGRRLYLRVESQDVIWPVAEGIGRAATEPVRVGGTAYKCALEGAWQAVDRLRRHVFIDQQRPRPAANLLCSLILDGPDTTLTSAQKAKAVRYWPLLVAGFREAFEGFDAQELSTLLGLEANRLEVQVGREAPRSSRERGRRRKEDKLHWLADAMLMVKEHPDWTNNQIAEIVGRHPSQLSRSDIYRRAAEDARKRGQFGTP